jgi:glucose-1-phosphate thymidylyltransferase
MAIVGVLPAAGYATRLQPLEGSKEVLPIAGRPMMDHVIERMRVGRCDEIRVVTRPEKGDVIAHAEKVGARVVLARPQTVSESFVAGFGGLAPEDVVLIGWPDTLWEPQDGYVRLLDVLGDDCEIALGLFRLDRDLERSDVVTLDERNRVTRVHVKPVVPSSNWVWGCAAARAHLLVGLVREDWPGDYFDVLARQGVDIVGVRLSDRWLDIGTKEALARAAHWRASG